MFHRQALVVAAMLVGIGALPPNNRSSYSPQKSATEPSPGVEKNNGTRVVVEGLDLADQTDHHRGDIQQLWEDDELDGPMRNALRQSSNSRWTEYRDAATAKFAIPYVISGQFTAQERNNIQRAMDAIERNTCVKYRPRNGELNFVDIQSKQREGCYTQVGRLRGRQVVMLEQGWTRSCGPGCTQTYPGCLQYSTVIHELMHKIGLWHEQMRFDRDQFIRVRYENIPEALHSQFAKVSEQRSSTYGVAYDYRSVMHYGKSSGAKQRGVLTMETVDKQYQDVIGTANDASAGDYQKICAIYECKQCMGKPFNGPTAANNNGARNSGNGGNAGGAAGRSASRCVPASSECGKTIRPGTALHNILCCP